MRWTLLLACSLLVVPLTGCASPDDGGEDEPAFAVAWEEEPSSARAGETVTMSWSVDGPEGQIPHTGVHYANFSVSDPQTPADYGNTVGAREPAQVPGTFDAALTLDEPGTYHVRAHAIVGEGEHRWSEEVQIQIAETESEAESGNHTVAIEDFDYDPVELTVRPGDRITWENADRATHTVTFDDEALGDSGDVEAGETYTLTVPEDLDEGTYSYSCTYHSSMQANITVEAPAD